MIRFIILAYDDKEVYDYRLNKELDQILQDFPKLDVWDATKRNILKIAERLKECKIKGVIK